MAEESHKIKITGMIVGGVILLALLAMFVYFQSNPSQTVSVTGNAEIDVMPDLMTVYFNVESKADTAKEAKDMNTEIVENVTSALLDLGFEEDEIVTENYNIYPEYDWGKSSIEEIGYKAVHNLKIELSEEKFDLAGEVIDAGVDAGALIGYINFELSNEKQNEYKTQALQQATSDARAKAEGIADGLNAKLGRIVSVSSSDFGYAPRTLYAAEGAASMDSDEAKDAVQEFASSNVQPGELTVSGRVSVLYALR